MTNNTNQQQEQLNKQQQVGTFRDLAIDDFKHYGRRYEQVCLIVAGFGIYGVKQLAELNFMINQTIVFILVIAAVCFALSIILSLISLSLEKTIRGHYLQLFMGDKEQKKDSSTKSLRLENIGIKISRFNLSLIIIGIVLIGLGAFQVFSMIK